MEVMLIILGVVGIVLLGLLFHDRMEDRREKSPSLLP